MDALAFAISATCRGNSAQTGEDARGEPAQPTKTKHQALPKKLCSIPTRLCLRERLPSMLDRGSRRSKSAVGDGFPRVQVPQTTRNELLVSELALRRGVARIQKARAPRILLAVALAAAHGRAGAHVYALRPGIVAGASHGRSLRPGIVIVRTASALDEFFAERAGTESEVLRCAERSCGDRCPRFSTSRNVSDARGRLRRGTRLLGPRSSLRELTARKPGSGSSWWALSVRVTHAE